MVQIGLPDLKAYLWAATKADFIGFTYRQGARKLKELVYLNKFFKKYSGKLLLGILFVSLSNYFRVLQPRVIREALDLVIDNLGVYNLYNGSTQQASLFSQIGTTLIIFGGLVLLFAFMMGVFMYFMRQTIIVMSRLIEYDLRKELFEKYESLSSSFFKQHNTGDLMSRISEDVSKVRMYVGPALLYGINLVSLFVMVIWSMLQVSPELTLYALMPLPILSISIYYVSNLINKKSEQIQIQLAELNSTSQEVYSGIRMIKSYVQEIPMIKFFRDQSQDYLVKSLGLAKVNALFFPLMLLLIGASIIITVYVGGLQVVSGSISPGNIAEFVIYVNMLTWPVTAIGWIASIVQQASASQKRINEFLKLTPEIENLGTNKTPIKGKLEFKDVTFVYPDSGTVALKNVNFTLKPGQRLAILGKTGSGKSTIAELLVRAYNIEKGAILIDETPIQDFELNHLRKRIGYVPQDGFLFSDTVAGNISFGKPDASQDEIEQFAKFAAVHDDILQLDQGYQSMVGERGVTLSGGQKQRVSIARALIKKPEIIILDDCLSAVDTNTEQQILNAFNTVLANKTTIIITHRIYAQLGFDHIIVLDEGKMVEQGSHSTLLKQKGFYFELFERQKAEEAEQPS